jgi:hypothetical protein
MAVPFLAAAWSAISPYVAMASKTASAINSVKTIAGVAGIGKTNSATFNRAVQRAYSREEIIAHDRVVEGRKRHTALTGTSKAVDEDDDLN